MSSTALYTTIYPGAEPYVNAWFDSVFNQTDKNFDIVIALDNFTKKQLFDLVGRNFSARFVIADQETTPAEVREKAFSQIAADYKQAVFTDCDDILHPKRIAIAKTQLAECDLCACALHIIDEDGSDLARTFPLPENANLESLLPRANVFGLSNTAYRCDLLKELLPFPKECVLLDWFMATKAWLMGANLQTTSAELMSYRQYHDNTARVLPPFNSSHIDKACTLLKKHYALLKKHILPDFGDRKDLFTAAEQKLNIFINSMSNSEKNKKYLSELNKLNENHIWWSWIAHPELEEIWKN